MRVLLIGWPFFIALMIGQLAAASFEVPVLKSPVMDTGGMIDSRSQQELKRLLQQIRQAGGAQITILTVPDLGGLPISQASIQVTDKWKLGGAKQDDGVLVLVAKEERRIRIEVGQGLEGVLTDVQSKRIIEDTILPLFRAGQVGRGLMVGVLAIARATSPEALAKIGSGSGDAPVDIKRDFSSWFFFFFLFLMILFRILGGRRSFWGGVAGGLLGSQFPRGGGWGGGGGGGWSGGGGGFSGGGASGGW